MKLSPNSLEAQLLKLDARDRARLAELLLSSLDGNEADVEAEWADEAERRLEELRSGVVAGIPAEEVFGRTRARLAK
jgi:putative addiction module component (TIGR02574 family)